MKSLAIRMLLNAFFIFLLLFITQFLYSNKNSNKKNTEKVHKVTQNIIHSNNLDSKHIDIQFPKIMNQNQFKKRKSFKKSHSAVDEVFSFFIKIYQVAISSQDGPTCPFSPTCSRFGREAIAKHGFIKGTFLTADRLTRCNHQAKGGKDPVP